jgi:hypothetical protein
VNKASESWLFVKGGSDMTNVVNFQEAKWSSDLETERLVVRLYEGYIADGIELNNEMKYYLEQARERLRATGPGLFNAI